MGYYYSTQSSFGLKLGNTVLGRLIYVSGKVPIKFH